MVHEIQGMSNNGSGDKDPGPPTIESIGLRKDFWADIDPTE
jgi:hypothetical protein